MGNDILIAFQQADFKLKKEADLNVKKFEEEELELTGKGGGKKRKSNKKRKSYKKRKSNNKRKYNKKKKI